MAWYNYFTIEIPMLLTTYAMMMEMLVMTNLYIYRTCYTILNYSKENCSKLGREESDFTQWLEPKVQPTVNHINMAQSTITTTIPLVVCMYVGLWSDRFGRKPFLITTLVGMVISMVFITVVIYFEDLTPWWFIAGIIPYSFTGGMGAFMLLVTTYMADTTTTKQRALRLSFFEATVALGTFLGNLSSSFLLYSTNYLVVFLIITSLMVISLAHVIFFIPESLKQIENGTNPKKISEMVNFKDIIRDTFKKRPNNGRTHLLIIMVIMFLTNFGLGEFPVFILYLRAKFNWNFTKITIVNSIFSIMNIASTVFGTVFLYKKFNIKEFNLAFLSIITTLVSCTFQTIATNDIQLYVGFLFSTFGDISGVMLRTVTSYIISPQEMGKIFAVNSILQGIDDLLSNLAYPYVYNLTLDTNSAAFNYLTMVIAILAGILIIYMMTVNFVHYDPSTEKGRPEGDFQKKESFSLSKMTASQKKNLSLDARTFRSLSISAEVP